ncbi:pilus assembly protein [Orbus wheelerorum]|uniref:TadE/TadG family type IV pilus assembly protein n=1 Tax=Orbus wheelerorum TaxID=3074111 RepID=UPI00370D5820
MRKFNYSFFTQKTGIISIEFAIIFPMFISLFLFSIEMSRIMLIGSSMDLVSTQVARKAAITENFNDYSKVIKEALSAEVPDWVMLTSSNDFTVKVNYCSSIDDVIYNRCNSNSADKNKIILFELKYNYSLIFSSLFSQLIDSSLNKRVVIYREFYS